MLSHHADRIKSYLSLLPPAFAYSCRYAYSISIAVRVARAFASCVCDTQQNKNRECVARSSVCEGPTSTALVYSACTYLGGEGRYLVLIVAPAEEVALVL